MNQNFEIVRGNDLRVTTEVRDNFGDPVDLSAATDVTWQVRQRAGLPLVLEKSLANGDFVFPTANSLLFDITNAESADLSGARYVHELQVTTAGGLIYSVLQGRIRVTQNIVE